MYQQSQYLTDMSQELSPKKKQVFCEKEQYHGVDIPSLLSSTPKNIIYDDFIYIILYVSHKWMIYKGINAF